MILEKCMGAQRCRRIQRALRHGKVTILCLVLTVVVLRGTIGAGKFCTPEQDFIEIRDHFYFRKRAEPHRVLEEVQTTSSDDDPNNYNAFDINTILKDEGEEEKPDPNKPYTLGPKISNWEALYDPGDDRMSSTFQIHTHRRWRRLSAIRLVFASEEGFNWNWNWNWNWGFG